MTSVERESLTHGASGRSARRPDSFFLAGLFAIAIVHVLYFGRSFLVPVVVALLLSFLLAPGVRFLARLWLPAPLAAAIVLAVLLGGVGAGVYQLAAPAAAWIDTVPRTLDRFKTSIGELSGTVASVREATDAVEEMATLGDEGEAAPQQVEVAGTGLSDSLFNLTVGFFVQLFFAMALLYALLASGNFIVDKIIAFAPGIDAPEKILAVARNAEKQFSRYLITITAINFVLGVATTAAMWFLDMPNPILWGVLAGLFNFVPIVGSLVTSSVLLLVAATEFTELSRIVLPPLAFLVLTGTEAYFVTPAILAQRLTLSLVAVFLSLFFWGWLWGPVGGLLAVPMLAAVKILADQVESMAPISRFLS